MVKIFKTKLEDAKKTSKQLFVKNTGNFYFSAIKNFKKSQSGVFQIFQNAFPYKFVVVVKNKKKKILILFQIITVIWLNKSF